MIVSNASHRTPARSATPATPATHLMDAIPASTTESVSDLSPVAHFVGGHEAEPLIQRPPVGRGVQHDTLDLMCPGPAAQLLHEPDRDPPAPPAPLGAHVHDQALRPPQQPT